MEEFQRYVRIIKQILDRDYGKERVFYDSGDWYDRNFCRNLSLDELEKEVLDIVNQSERNYEHINQLTDKIYELMGEEKAEEFLDSLEEKENQEVITKVTATEIVEEIERRIINSENADLSNTMGALNGLDMDTYMKGYLDALRQLKGFFETRV